MRPSPPAPDRKKASVRCRTSVPEPGAPHAPAGFGHRPPSAGPSRERGAVRGVIALGALVLFFLAMLAVVAGLTFSVVVAGSSMEPTLQEGDRLQVDLLDRHAIERFDLIEARQPGPDEDGGGRPIIKRVIGLPGDQVAIAGDPIAPQVLIKPAGEDKVFRVDNPAWPPRIGASIESCCTAEGTAVRRGTQVWATVPESSYWVLGDNWGASTDSRLFGWVSQDRIEARLWFRILPASRFGSIDNDVRLVPVSAIPQGSSPSDRPETTANPAP